MLGFVAAVAVLDAERYSEGANITLFGVALAGNITAALPSSFVVHVGIAEKAEAKLQGQCEPDSRVERRTGD
ncbi:hypothetical protein [Kribbella sp. ALI-6-A]|uniref:hypothetical protein n=1 Tax=Kribbella sp. ALI-6-A TaxID=1933817 RepID=UPI00117B5545|nr:hypothetical protein [Kribbella sp. ALI-6-A]